MFGWLIICPAILFCSDNIHIYIYIYNIHTISVHSSVYNMLETIRDFKTPQKVLILGVGRSNVVDVLYEHGFREITCIDISPMIISQMQNKYRQHSGVDCEYSIYMIRS